MSGMNCGGAVEQAGRLPSWYQEVELMTRFMTERSAVSLALLLIGSGLTFSTFGSGVAEMGEAFDPTFFPHIVLVAWMGLAALTLVTDVADRQRPEPIRVGATVTAALGLFAYALLMTELGFFICSVLFCVLILMLTGQRRLMVVTGYSLAVPAVVTLTFNHLLKMPLPSSPFVWWL